MNYFEKVSYEIYEKAVGGDEYLGEEYDEIIVPHRSTKYSAGYDFFAPCDIDLKDGEEIVIPTGIRCVLDRNKVLLIVPRSGLGFKYGMKLANTVGVIDADYAGSDNMGHIFAKIVNDNSKGEVLHIKKGSAFMQGIIVQYHTCDEDDVQTIRNGGFGSTDILASA